MGGKPNRKESYGFINLIAIVACFAVIVVILSVLFAKFIIDRASESDGKGSESSSVSYSGDTSGSEHGSDESYPSESGTDIEPVSGNESGAGAYDPELSSEVSEEEPCRIIMLEEEDVHKGSLIVVNSDNPYDFSREPVTVNIYKSRTAKTFKVSDNNLFILQSVMEPLQSLMNALSAYTGNSALTITVAYRTEDAQKKLYDEGKERQARFIDFGYGGNRFCRQRSIQGNSGAGK